MKKHNDIWNTWNDLFPSEMFQTKTYSNESYTYEVSDTGMTLFVDMPGVDGKSIDVVFTPNNVIKITGQRSGKKTLNSHQFNIDEAYDVASTKASYKDGLLKLKIEKFDEKTKSSKINVELI